MWISFLEFEQDGISGCGCYEGLLFFVFVNTGDGACVFVECFVRVIQFNKFVSL